MNKIQSDSVVQAIQQIICKYNAVRRVILFGSRGRGDNTVHSDYDIAVFSSDSEQNTRLKDEFDNIATLNRLDIVFIGERHQGTELYRNILRDGVDIVNKFQIKLKNYQKALDRLYEGIAEAKQSASLTMRDGVIQRFEFTAELAWKTTREYLLTLEIMDINSPKQVMKEAFNNNLLADEQGWLKILQDRNATSHIYDEAEAEEIFARITTKHITLFTELAKVLADKAAK